MNSQILPPPHLNLTNSAYFPGLNQPVNYMPNPMHPYPIPQANLPQMSFNCNLNMFINPFYAPNPYGMMHPWMECFGMPQMGQILYEKMDQNYLMAGNIQQKTQRFSFGSNGYHFQVEPKTEMRARHQEIIVIDDDDEEKMEKPQIYAWMFQFKWQFYWFNWSKRLPMGMNETRVRRSWKEETEVDNMLFFSGFI